MLRRPAAGTICRRGLSALARAAVALLLVTCTDDPIGPGHGGIATLRLQPVFDAFSRNAGLPLDQVRVIVIRPPSDTLANVNQHFDPTSQQLRLNIPVRLERSTESLELHLEMYSGSILLFTGMDFVTVTAGTTNPAAPITMTYQGPGTNVGSVTLTPRDTTVLFGGSFDFQASAVDSQQQPVVQFYVGWTASAGTVDGNGRFTAPNAVDTVLVTATTPTGITDATRVFVIAPPAALVKSGGDQQSAPAGSRLPLPLEVRVDDASGQPVPGIAVAFAVVTGGGSVDSAAATTDARGIARTGATLGSAVGVQSFTATVSGVAPVTFTATATTFSPLGRPLAAGEDHTC
jgi:hypothetical protein